MTIEMYDSITAGAIPAGPAAGYVDGRWRTFPTIQAQGRPHVLSIAVFASDDAECLDVENGDATPGQAPGWVKRQLARGVYRPVVYTSLSQAVAVLGQLAAAGVARQQVRLWLAHYTMQAHICAPACGFGLNTIADGTQWTDRAMGRNLDESRLIATFFDIPTPEEASKHMAALNEPIVAVVVRPQNDGYWLVAQDGGIFSFGNAAQFGAHDTLPAHIAGGHWIENAACSPSGNGLYLVGEDGGVFTFGDAVFKGSIPGVGLAPSTNPRA